MPHFDRLLDSLTGLKIRGGLPMLLAVGLAWGGLQLWPQAEVAVFARITAMLAGFLTGTPMVRVDEGWLLAGATQPVVVSAACSASGYFLTVVALLAWRLGPAGRSLPLAVGLAIIAAFPLTLGINALRVVVVTHAHRWVIPQFPEAYGHFLHMLAGVAVFLPALISLSLLLEFHGNSRRQVS